MVKVGLFLEDFGQIWFLPSILMLNPNGVDFLSQNGSLVFSSVTPVNLWGFLENG
jgi:hypothetical protein